MASTRAQAIALVCLIVGPTSDDTERDRWTIAVAGGRRVVELEASA